MILPPDRSAAALPDPLGLAIAANGRLTATMIAARFAKWDDFACRAHADRRRSACLPSTASDHPADAPVEGLKPAAVLIPLIDHAGGLTVLFTLRSAALSSHAGQVSFPGGRIDPHETDPAAAAVRETEEEIGIPREAIRIVGRLGDFVTGTGYRVTPVVGILRPPLLLAVNPAEVVEVFEVPLEFLLDRANHRVERGVLRGQERHYYVIPWLDRHIWGATAAMIVKFADFLTGPPPDA